MSTSCSNTCLMIEVLWQIIDHSISIARQSSARQCWSVLVCISDSVPASRPTHDNPTDWDLANSVAIRFFPMKPGHFFLIQSWARAAVWAGVPSCWKRSCPTGNSEGVYTTRRWPRQLRAVALQTTLQPIAASAFAVVYVSAEGGHFEHKLWHLRRHCEFEWFVQPVRFYHQHYGCC